MKNIELNPNCSELVTHLGATGIKEVCEAIKGMYMIKDIVLCAVFPMEGEKGERMKYRAFPIPFDKYEGIICIQEDCEGGRKLVVNLEMLALHWQELEDKKVCLTSYDSNEIRLIPAEECKGYTEIVDMDDRSSLRLTFGDGYCGDNSLTIECSQHCAESEFPAFYRALDLFKSKYESHDGGSVADFESWMKKKKYYLGKVYEV